MKSRTLSLLSVAALAAGCLSGCALLPTGPSTIPTDEFLSPAEDALEDEYDVRYSVDDCEDEEVPFRVGKGTDCVATDRDSDTDYEVSIELSEVDGSRFEIEVELGDVITDGDDGEDGDDEDGGDDDDDALYITSSQLADTTVDALEDVIDFTPTDMECETDELELFVGNYDYCYFTGPDDDVYTVEVEITKVDTSSGRYEISAEVL